MPSRRRLLLPRSLFAIGLGRAARGSRPWTIFVIGALTVRVLRRMRAADDEPLYRTVVRPGDRFEVIARAPR